MAAIVPHNRGFLSFATLDEPQPEFGPDLPIVATDEVGTDEFLESGLQSSNIPRGIARNQFADLARQGVDGFCRSRGLLPFLLGARGLAWWLPIGRSHEDQVRFEWEPVVAALQTKKIGPDFISDCSEL